MEPTTSIQEAYDAYVPSIGILTPPKPAKATHYIGASINPAHPDSVYDKVAKGFTILTCKEAVDKHGYTDRAFGQGGFLDKTNNWVTNGDTVVMVTPFENATRLNEMAAFRTAQIKGLREDEFQELAERLDAAYKVTA